MSSPLTNPNVTAPDPFTRDGACSSCSASIVQTVNSQHNRDAYLRFGGRHPIPDFAWKPEQCETCEAARREAEARAVEQHQAQLAIAADEASAAALTRTGVPPRLRADLETFEPLGDSLTARRAIDALLAGAPGWPVLFGPPGCGKSTEAGRAILRRFESNKGQHLPASSPAAWSWARPKIEDRDRFVTLSNLVLQVTETYTRGAERSTLDVLNEFRTAPLLVLDDVGAERPTAHTVGVLQAVIDHRYSQLLPTIITSNLGSLADLGVHLCSLGDDTLPARRIVDRLAEMAIVVKINSTSHRPAIGRALREGR